VRHLHHANAINFLADPFDRAATYDRLVLLERMQPEGRSLLNRRRLKSGTCNLSAVLGILSDGPKMLQPNQMRGGVVPDAALRKFGARAWTQGSWLKEAACRRSDRGEDECWTRRCPPGLPHRSKCPAEKPARSRQARLRSRSRRFRAHSFAGFLQRAAILIRFCEAAQDRVQLTG